MQTFRELASFPFGGYIDGPRLAGGGGAYANAELRFAPSNTYRLKASDVSSLGDGNSVASILLRHTDDVNAVQASDSNRPTYEDISGRSALQFVAGSSDYLAADAGELVLTSGVTVVVLANAVNTGRFLSWASLTTDDALNSLFFSADVGLGIGGAASRAHGIYTDYTVNSSGLALFSGRFSGSEIANWLNGVKRNGTAVNSTELSDGSLRPDSLPNATATQLLQFGRRLHSSNNLYFSGDLYDVLIINAALMDEEVQYLEGVIAWDNNATTLLPADHPWKSTRPSTNASIGYIWATGGMVVARSTAPATSYIASPSLCIASDSALYALHDFSNASDSGSTGALYRSSNNGKTWTQLATFADFQWGSIWQHTDGNLYILATTRAFGDLKIGKSTDGGANWAWTTLSASGGPLAAAGAGTTAPNYHRAGGLPPLYHDSHIFAAVENLDPYSRESGFRPLVLYCPDDVDLMDKANWTASSQLAIGAHSFGANAGMFEGNIVVDDADQMWDVLRFSGGTTPDKAVFLPLTWDGADITMPTWDSGYIKDFSGGNVKFQLVKYGNYFYALTNDNTGVQSNQRNRVTLLKYSSADLTTPAFATDLLVVDQDNAEAYTGMSEADSGAYHGFQYPSFVIEDGIVRALYRVAWSGADDFHDANFLGYGEFALP